MQETCPAYLAWQEIDIVFVTQKNPDPVKDCQCHAQNLRWCWWWWCHPENDINDAFPFAAAPVCKVFVCLRNTHKWKRLPKRRRRQAKTGVAQRQLWHLSASQMMGLCSQVLLHPAVPPRRERAEQTGYHSFHLFSPVIFMCHCCKPKRQRCRE